jgi:hypothetical protein
MKTLGPVVEAGSSRRGAVRRAVILGAALVAAIAVAAEVTQISIKALDQQGKVLG